MTSSVLENSELNEKHIITLILFFRSLVSQVPSDYLRTLVEEVRSSTNISYTTSHQVRHFSSDDSLLVLVQNFSFVPCDTLSEAS